MYRYILWLISAYTQGEIDDFVLDDPISSALALEILQSYIKPSVYKDMLTPAILSRIYQLMFRKYPLRTQIQQKH